MKISNTTLLCNNCDEQEHCPMQQSHLDKTTANDRFHIVHVSKPTPLKATECCHSSQYIAVPTGHCSPYVRVVAAIISGNADDVSVTHLWSSSAAAAPASSSSDMVCVPTRFHGEIHRTLDLRYLEKTYRNLKLGNISVIKIGNDEKIECVVIGEGWNKKFIDIFYGPDGWNEPFLH